MSSSKNPQYFEAKFSFLQGNSSLVTNSNMHLLRGRPRMQQFCLDIDVQACFSIRKRFQMFQRQNLMYPI